MAQDGIGHYYFLAQFGVGADLKQKVIVLMMQTKSDESCEPQNLKVAMVEEQARAVVEELRRALARL